MAKKNRRMLFALLFFGAHVYRQLSFCCRFSLGALTACVGW
jgi:hypothetical protein